MPLSDWHEVVRKYIPPDFSFEAYAPCKEFGPKEWYSEIDRRRTWCFHHWSFRHGLLPYRPEVIFGVDRTRMSQDTTQTRFVEDLTVGAALKIRDILALNPHVGELLDFETRWSEAVRDWASQEEIRQAHPDFQDYINAKTGGEQNLSVTRESPYYKTMILGVVDTGDEMVIVDPAYAMIDLKVPDKVLVEHFKLWLAEIREKLDKEPPRYPRHTSKESRLRDSNLKSWADNRILEYLDLIHWFELNGLKQPKQDEWFAVVFPDQYRTEEGSVSNFAKQTVKIAKWLMSDEGAALLRGFAYQEATNNPTE